MGSQILCDYRDFLVNQALIRAYHRLQKENAQRSNGSAEEEEDEEEEEENNINFSRPYFPSERGYNLDPGGFHSSLDPDPANERVLNPDGAAGVYAGQTEWREVGASTPEDGGYVTIQLNPIQLYHGEAEGGVMRVKFSVQSTVKRRVKAEMNRGGGIEEIYAAVTNPTVQHLQMAGHPAGSPDVLLEQETFVQPVKVQKKVRRRRVRRGKRPGKEDSNLPAAAGVGIEDKENQIPKQSHRRVQPKSTDQIGRPTQSQCCEQEQASTSSLPVCIEPGNKSPRLPAGCVAQEQVPVAMKVPTVEPNQIPAMEPSLIHSLKSNQNAAFEPNQIAAFEPNQNLNLEPNQKITLEPNQKGVIQLKKNEPNEKTVAEQPVAVMDGEDGVPKNVHSSENRRPMGPGGSASGPGSTASVHSGSSTCAGDETSGGSRPSNAFRYTITHPSEASSASQPVGYLFRSPPVPSEGPNLPKDDDIKFVDEDDDEDEEGKLLAKRASEHSKLPEDYDDIKFADDEDDEDDSWLVQYSNEGSNTSSLSSPSDVSAGASVPTTKKSVGRQNLPPPPLPPIAVGKYTKAKKKSSGGSRRKVKQSRPPLSPVKEEFDGTAEEMEEMEAILEEADDSFEQLLISAEDDVLISSKSDQSSRDDLDLDDFVGAAAPAVINEEEFEALASHVSLTSPVVKEVLRFVDRSEERVVVRKEQFELSSPDEEETESQEAAVKRVTGEMNLREISGRDDQDKKMSKPLEHKPKPLEPELKPLEVEDMSSSDDELREFAESLGKGSGGSESDTESHGVESPPELVGPSDIVMHNVVMHAPEIIVCPPSASTEKLMKFNEVEKPLDVEENATGIGKTFEQKPEVELPCETPSSTMTERKRELPKAVKEEQKEEFTAASRPKVDASAAEMSFSKENQGVKIGEVPRKTTCIDDLSGETGSSDVRRKETCVDDLPFADDADNYSLQDRDDARDLTRGLTEGIPDCRINTKNHSNKESGSSRGREVTDVGDIIPAQFVESSEISTFDHTSPKYQQSVDSKRKRKNECAEMPGQTKPATEVSKQPSEFERNKIVTNVDDIDMDINTADPAELKVEGKPKGNLGKAVQYVQKPKKGVKEQGRDTERTGREFEKVNKTEKGNGDLGKGRLFVDPKKSKAGKARRDIKEVGGDLNRVGQDTECRGKEDEGDESEDLNESGSIKHKEVSQLSLDEGPIGTSSPKIGRANKSQESPFKTYPQKLGKSEETLLDIMPLRQPKAMIVAKSQEGLVESSDDEPENFPLSRTSSLGPHHRNKRHKRVAAPVVVNSASKETDVDDISRAPGSPGREGKVKVLDQYHLMKHNEMMELSSARSVFKPAPGVTPSVSSEALPPLPETTDVPSISDSEGRQKHAEESRIALRAAKVKRQDSNTTGVSEVTASEDGTPKKRWVPKQRRDKRKGQRQAEEIGQNETTDSVKAETQHSEDHRESPSQVRRIGRVAVNSGTVPVDNGLSDPSAIASPVEIKEDRGVVHKMQETDIDAVYVNEDPSVEDIEKDANERPHRDLDKVHMEESGDADKIYKDENIFTEKNEEGLHAFAPSAGDIDERMSDNHPRSSQVAKRDTLVVSDLESHGKKPLTDKVHLYPDQMNRHTMGGEELGDCSKVGLDPNQMNRDSEVRDSELVNNRNLGFDPDRMIGHTEAPDEQVDYETVGRRESEIKDSDNELIDGESGRRRESGGTKGDNRRGRDEKDRRDERGDRSGREDGDRGDRGRRDGGGRDRRSHDDGDRRKRDDDDDDDDDKEKRNRKDRDIREASGRRRKRSGDESDGENEMDQENSERDEDRRGSWGKRKHAGRHDRKDFDREGVDDHWRGGGDENGRWSGGKRRDRHSNVRDRDNQRDSDRRLNEEDKNRRQNDGTDKERRKPYDSDRKQNHDDFTGSKEQGNREDLRRNDLDEKDNRRSSNRSWKRKSDNPGRGRTVERSADEYDKYSPGQVPNAELSQSGYQDLNETDLKEEGSVVDSQADEKRPYVRRSRADRRSRQKRPARSDGSDTGHRTSYSTNIDDPPSLSVDSSFSPGKIEVLEMTSPDSHLRAPRLDPDVQSSPRLSRRRGGAIAPRDESDKRRANLYGAIGKDKSKMPKKDDGLLKVSRLGDSLTDYLRRSNVSLASSTHSRRSHSSSRVFDNSPEHIPPKPQIDPLTGEPFYFIHPLMSKSMESLRSRSSERGSLRRSDHSPTKTSVSGAELSPVKTETFMPDDSVPSESVPQAAKSETDMPNRRHESVGKESGDVEDVYEPVVPLQDDSNFRHGSHQAPEAAKMNAEKDLNLKSEGRIDVDGRHSSEKNVSVERPDMEMEKQGEFEGGRDRGRYGSRGDHKDDREERSYDRGTDGENSPSWRGDHKGRRNDGYALPENENRQEHNSKDLSVENDETDVRAPRESDRRHKHNSSGRHDADDAPHDHGKRRSHDDDRRRRHDDEFSRDEEDLSREDERRHRRDEKDSRRYRDADRRREGDRRRRHDDDDSFLEEDQDERRDYDKSTREDDRRRRRNKEERRRSDPDKDDRRRSGRDKDNRHRSEPDRDDSQRSESGRDDRRRSDPDKDDRRRSDPDKDNRRRSGRDKDDRHRSEPDRDDSRRLDPERDARRSEPDRDDRQRSEPDDDRRHDAGERRRRRGKTNDRPEEEDESIERDHKKSSGDDRRRDRRRYRDEDNDDDQDDRMEGKTRRKSEERKPDHAQIKRGTRRHRSEDIPHAPSEANVKTDLGPLLAENPIEVQLEQEKPEEDDDSPPLSPKKGFLSRLSCVGGRSSDVSQKKDKSKNKAPLEKTKEDNKKGRDFYDEGEKRKIKKLAKDQEKQPKDLYFIEAEDHQLGKEEDVDQDTKESPIAPDGAPSRTPDYSPHFSESQPRRAHYTKKSDSLERRKPLSTFTEPIKPLELDHFDDLLPMDDRVNDVLSRIAEEESLQSVASSSRDATKVSTFKTASEMGNDFPSSRQEPQETHGFASNSDAEKQDRSWNAEDEEPAAKETPRSKTWEPRARRDLTSRPRSRPSVSPPKVPLLPGGSGGSYGEAGVGQSGNIQDMESPPLDSAALHRSQEEDSSFESPIQELNTSAPAHFNVGHRNVFGPARDHNDSGGGPDDDPVHLTDSSVDPSSSFDTSDLNHRRRNRAVSFDDGYTPTLSNPPFSRLPQDGVVGSSDGLPARRRVSQTSIGTLESGSSRPRSTSTTSSNPLTYQPWRAKARRRSRSMSISEMVYAAGVPRPRRSHSIGEIFNSTVASSVARRRSRTPSVGDIQTRMYQPRQRSRSRASLGDTSFGSAAPARQRRISRESVTAGSGDQVAHSAHPAADPANSAVKRSESERQPSRNPEREELGEDKPASPAKSDTLRSTDSASGGETLEERSSKEGSPTKEHPSPTKDKKKKKKFRMPSFSKKKNKESKESAI
ncbi:nervous system adducin isoform X2 [Aplysia californica]|uniref:Nervous system adducin isoform X2 n=1 Tax=Aplysia californica TaxID=6500 RepID=A0ABM0ZUP0_APLCA|nr:nervous system adducin isoform X2 [Aplysia californica]